MKNAASGRMMLQSSVSEGALCESIFSLINTFSLEKQCYLFVVVILSPCCVAYHAVCLPGI